MIFALIGNQNCGKTTLFNVLTGASQRVGNFPGVTVEKKTGTVLKTSHQMVDLPGIYSLRPFSQEERLTQDFLLESKPDAILNIVDASNLERNLYLTLQLLTLEIPIVVALNMMDVVLKSGGRIDIPRLEKTLGLPVIPISAAKGEGVDTLADTLVNTAKARRRPDIRRTLSFPGTDGDVALAQARYRFIEDVCRGCVKIPKQPRSRFDFDRIALGRFTAYPLFLGILAQVFYFTFRLLGPFLSEALAQSVSGFSQLAQSILISWDVHPVLRGLIIDGGFAGVGSALSFLPVILVLFFFLSLLEDSGYMARVAFIMDKPMGYLGLSGKSFVPLLLGFGCTVPAAMAARTLPTQNDRRMTVLLTPFMSCSAKIPIYSVFAAAFFPGRALRVMCFLYGGGILMGILAAAVFNRAVYSGETADFLLELPVYRLPTLKNGIRLMWEKAKDFVGRAFTVIFLSSVTIWVLQTYDPCFHIAQDAGESILALLGRQIAPLFAPLGFGSWQAVTALAAGFTAKEAVVSTFAILLSVSPENLPYALSSLFSPASAAAFLTFTLLYTPCVAAVTAMGRELGSVKKALGVVVMQCAIAWLAAFLVYQIVLFL